jgi:tetratricopeptide (TPR) repeat protein
LGVATWRQAFVWRNSVELLEHALDVTGHNWFARLYLAAELVRHYEFERAQAMLKQSLSDGAAPATIHRFMGAIYDRENREEDALHEIDAALAVEPENWHMLVDRGLYLTNLHRNAEAVAVLQQAIALDSGDNLNQLGLARRLLATAQRRLGEEEGPGAGHWR